MDTVEGFMPFLHSITHVILHMAHLPCPSIESWMPCSQVHPYSSTQLVLCHSRNFLSGAVVSTFIRQGAALSSHGAEMGCRLRRQLFQGEEVLFVSRIRQETAHHVRINTSVSSKEKCRWKTQPLRTSSGRLNVSMRLACIYSISKLVKSFCC